MVRQHTSDLEQVLTGSFERELTVNVFNGSNRVISGAQFESWQLEADLGGRIRSSGRGVVVWTSTDGSSMSPVGTNGVLSPFRARLELVMTIRAGSFVESVSLGMFRVIGVPEAQDFTVSTINGEKVVASRVGVRFESLDTNVDRRGFTFPEQSKAGASAFSEIRRLTGMPLEQTVPDVILSAGKAWEAKKGGRLDAVLELGKELGGQAVVNSRGAWEIIPDAVGSPVLTLSLGEQGTVLDVADEIDTDNIYNEVVGSFEDPDGKPFYSIARVTSGDLSVDGLYETNTLYYANERVKTQAMGDKMVGLVLARSTGSQQYDVQIQCHVNPLVEIGDVVRLSQWKRPLSGQVRSVDLGDSEYMTVTVRVSRELS